MWRPPSMHSLGPDRELDTGSKLSFSLDCHCCLHFYKLASAGSLEFVDHAALQDVLWEPGVLLGVQFRRSIQQVNRAMLG